MTKISIAQFRAFLKKDGWQSRTSYTVTHLNSYLISSDAGIQLKEWKNEYEKDALKFQVDIRGIATLTCVLDELTIIYQEPFLYSQGKFVRSYFGLDEDMPAYRFSGFVVVDKNHQALDPELVSAAVFDPINNPFGRINYSRLAERKALCLTDTNPRDKNTAVLKLSKLPSLGFNGIKLATVNNRQVKINQLTEAMTKRWSSFTLYQSLSAGYVVQHILHSQSGKAVSCARVCNNEQELIDYCGDGPLAQALYLQCKIRPNKTRKRA